MFRDFLETVAWVGLGLTAVGVVGFVPAIELLHWLDRRQERKFHDGQAVHS